MVSLRWSIAILFVTAIHGLPADVTDLPSAVAGIPGDIAGIPGDIASIPGNVDVSDHVALGYMKTADAVPGGSNFLLYPGTNWCGAGNRAENYDDLGILNNTDNCCRKHDHCPDGIEGYGSKYGLNNTAFYTRLPCECDEEFYRCLKKVNTKPSNSIGVTYFDSLNTQCFREEYPIVKCDKHSLLIPTRCVHYKLDKSKPKEWQWFDVPTYYVTLSDSARYAVCTSKTIYNIKNLPYCLIS